MSITQNKARIGNFTSSQISRLVEGTRGLSEAKQRDLLALEQRHHLAEQGEGKVLTEKMKETMLQLQHDRDNPKPTKSQLTYIEEKQIELRLGRSIRPDKYSRPGAWGQFMEHFVFENFTGLGYRITSNDTIYHPTIDGWSGSPDMIEDGVKVADIKCYEPKKFAQYTDALLLGDLANLKKNFAQEYWQLVSHAILANVPKAEAITYIPYQSELKDIREHASNWQGEDQWKYRFIYEGADIELPYIPEGGYYKNINRFEFEVPQEDRDFLTDIVLESIALRDQA